MMVDKVEIFDSLKEAQDFAKRLAGVGVSFKIRIVSYRKRLKLPVQYEVTVYG